MKMTNTTSFCIVKSLFCLYLNLMLFAHALAKPILIEATLLHIIDNALEFAVSATNQMLDRWLSSKSTSATEHIIAALECLLLMRRTNSEAILFKYITYFRMGFISLMYRLSRRIIFFSNISA